MAEGAGAAAGELTSPMSSVKPWFVRKVLELPETGDWSGGPHAPFKLVDLLTTSEEFKRAEARFQATVPATSVFRIQRVENPFLLAEFLMKKIKMGPSVAEKRLFHGTGSAHIDGICRDNFNWRLSGSSKGHKFGQGTSFARDAYYATHYTQGSSTMIFARVLVCRSTIGDLSTVIPPEPFDATQNYPGTVTVKYEDDDCYPEYVIHYETLGKTDDGKLNRALNDLTINVEQLQLNLETIYKSKK